MTITMPDSLPKAHGEETEIGEVIRSSLVKPEDGKIIKGTYTRFFDEAHEWADKGLAITVTGEDQEAEMKIAHDYRMKIRNIRLDADKIRKAMKENSNRYNKAVQSVYNIVEAICKPAEDHLQLQEDYAKIKEQERIDAIAIARSNEMEPFEAFIPEGYDYGTMAPEDFASLKTRAEKLKKIDDAEIKEREDAEAKVIEDKRLEDERLRTENETLRNDNDKLKQAAKEAEQVPEVKNYDLHIDTAYPDFTIGHHGISIMVNGIVCIQNIDTDMECKIPIADFDAMLENVIKNNK